jgi:hypothetical protein
MVELLYLAERANLVTWLLALCQLADIEALHERFARRPPEMTDVQVKLSLTAV